MIPQAVTDNLIFLRRAYARVQRIAGLAAVAAAAAAAAWLFALLRTPAHLPWPKALLTLLLAVYTACKLLQHARARQLRKQVRMEERFTRQRLDHRQLQACLGRPEHLWMHSCILRGLAVALASPLRLLRAEEQRRRLRRLYHHALHALHLPRLNLSMPLLVLILVVGAVHARSGAFGDVLAFAGLASILLALPVETAQAALQWRLQQHFSHFEEALSEWTLLERFPEALQADAAKPYTHTSLYRARPLLASHTTRSTTGDPTHRTPTASR